MKILVADDNLLTRRMLQALLTKWGYEVLAASDGIEAWNILKSSDFPRLAILDWMMPGMDGAQLCRNFRQLPKLEIAYFILLTSKDRKEDIVEGLEAGANDYITKPFDHEELRVRIQVGRQMVELQLALEARVKELQEAIHHIKTLQGILPICSYCKKIRDDKNYWRQLESYFQKYSEVQFSHGICPECYDRYVKPELEELRNKTSKANLKKTKVIKSYNNS